MDTRLISSRFPRATAYNPDWIIAAAGGANPLWLTEWLFDAIDLRPGMRVLDLGCGRGCSSVFLHRELGVDVWATDLWFPASERQARIRDAGIERGVYAVHADARALPFSNDFFDAVVSIDSYPYYGTDDLYLAYLARFVKPGGSIAIAGAGLVREIETVPDALRSWWEPSLSCLHSAAWWKRHWERSGIVDVTTADTMADGWQRWLEWHRVVCPENRIEIEAVEADRGETLGYVRAVARRRIDAKLDEPIVAIPVSYTKTPLLR
jgi:SAM-dependent methyltransferase